MPWPCGPGVVSGNGSLRRSAMRTSRNSALAFYLLPEHKLVSPSRLHAVSAAGDATDAGARRVARWNGRAARLSNTAHMPIALGAFPRPRDQRLGRSDELTTTEELRE